MEKLCRVLWLNRSCTGGTVETVSGRAWRWLVDAAAELVDLGRDRDDCAQDRGDHQRHSNNAGYQSNSSGVQLRRERTGKGRVALVLRGTVCSLW